MKKIAMIYLLTLPLMIMNLGARADSPELTCPESPNCVSSLATGKQNIPPFYFDASNLSQAKEKLMETLKDWPNAEIISSNDQIIITVFTTPWLKFKDDLILIIRPDGRIDIRSSSRAGYYDFGANRRRVERLRTTLKPNAYPETETR